MIKSVFPSSLKGLALLYGSLILLCLFSILFLDRNVAELMHQQPYGRQILKWFSYTPILLEFTAGLVIAACMSQTFRQKYLTLAIELLLTITLAFVTRLATKYLFGRTWPESWIEMPSGGHNPSWIADGIEAFHPFAEGLSYNSFPSGHALFTFALALTFWRHLPRFWLIWFSLLIGALAGQLGMNYHYLGDLIAGASFGLLVSHGAKHIAAKLSKLSPKARLN